MELSASEANSFEMHQGHEVEEGLVLKLSSMTELAYKNR